MTKLIFLPHEEICPEGAVIEVEPGITICDAAQENDIEIEHACEKSCACTTCHVIIREGFDSLEEAITKVKSELYLISFRNDVLFKNFEMKELDDVLEEVGNKNHTYIDIDSDYGHDAFLVELDKFEDYVKEALNA
jgi:ferredoxin